MVTVDAWFHVSWPCEAYGMTGENRVFAETEGQEKGRNDSLQRVQGVPGGGKVLGNQRVGNEMIYIYIGKPKWGMKLYIYIYREAKGGNAIICRETKSWG